MASTTEIVLPDSDEQIEQILVAQVWNDIEFNSRGNIIPLEVVTLANNIKEKGLMQPIVIQPWEPGFSKWVCPPGKKYRIVMGHRRYEAVKQLGVSKIKAIIKKGLSEEDALALNLIENIERKQLDLVQEAKSIQRFKLLGMTHREIAEKVKMSTGWVQVRMTLLELPIEIQQEAKLGTITTEHIKTIGGMNREEQFEAVRQIKDAKLAGTKLELRVRKKTAKVNPKEKKLRTGPEIEKMQDFIIDNMGQNLATRALAWSGGYIDNLAFMQSLKIWADQNGKPFSIPADYLE